MKNHENLCYAHHLFPNRNGTMKNGFVDMRNGAPNCVPALSLSTRFDNATHNSGAAVVYFSWLQFAG